MAGAALWFAAANLPAQTPPARDYQVKAVFLFNFAQFVEWPGSAFAGPTAPLIVGVLGDDPFGAFLDDVVRDEKVNGHTLVVRRFQRVEDVDTCHILFIGRSDTVVIARAIEALKGRGVLTVGDTDGFTQRGGMIRFVTDNSRVRLRINVDAARAAGLTISSKLLRPAEIVSTTKG